ncbi:MAG TPA: class III extradiol dioxygenase subunit B-like domain-containing protein [bacterium]|nr:class III extradiol dioxygenase subunit B-like domain-containing protein [bacterium]
MLSLAFIVPHSPILIPNIGKQNTRILKKTSESLAKIKKELIEKKIDTLIIISPHKKNNLDISLNNHFNLEINFEEFGDYLSKLNLNGDLELSYKIKEELWPDFDINIEAKSKADYGSSIPLYLLLSDNNQKIKNLKSKIIIINTSSHHDFSYHFTAGQKIQRLLKETDKNIAVLASGELSHCLNHNAPGGFFQKAIMFDEKTIESLKKGPLGVPDILKIDPKLALGAKECGLRPISLLLGILDNLDYQTDNMSYQKELGVGCLTMKFDLK